MCLNTRVGVLKVYWRPPGRLPDPGIEPVSLHLLHSRQIFYLLSHQGRLCNQEAHEKFLYIFSHSVQSLSCVRLLVTPWTAALQAFLSITKSWSSPKLMSIDTDAFQPSHPLLSPSPPALNLSQHQGLLKWVSSSNQVAKVLEFQLQHQSFQWTPRTDLH